MVNYFIKVTKVKQQNNYHQQPAEGENTVGGGVDGEEL